MLGNLITESEQAKSETVLQRTLSTWEPVLGSKYKIITTRGEGGRLDVVDFICPHCHHNIFWMLWNGNYCLNCGNPVFSAPNRKLDAQQFRNWHQNDMEGLRHAQSRDRAGAKAVPPRDHKLRARESPTRKSRLKHCLP
jgi:hypothetical protein